MRVRYDRLFNVGDGIYGLRVWIVCRVLAPVSWRLAERLAPSLPDGWQYNVRKGDRGWYARHDDFGRHGR